MQPKPDTGFAEGIAQISAGENRAKHVFSGVPAGKELNSNDCSE
jgi:hypothetical protein